jgi:hypothetical protein
MSKTSGTKPFVARLHVAKPGTDRVVQHLLEGLAQPPRLLAEQRIDVRVKGDGGAHASIMMLGMPLS